MEQEVKLTEEQLEAFKQCVKEANKEAYSIIFMYLVLTVVLTSANYFLFKYFSLPEGFRFLMYFLTGILLFSSLNSVILELSDRFKSEAQKILNNK